MSKVKNETSAGINESQEKKYFQEYRPAKIFVQKFARTQLVDFHAELATIRARDRKIAISLVCPFRRHGCATLRDD